MLNTLPFATMIIEYPCNQIPFDWRMLPFDIGFTVIYGVFNLFLCLFWNENNSPVYK